MWNYGANEEKTRYERCGQQTLRGSAGRGFLCGTVDRYKERLAMEHFGIR